MLSPEAQPSFEAASQAPTIAASDYSLNGEKKDTPFPYGTDRSSSPASSVDGGLVPIKAGSDAAAAEDWDAVDLAKQTTARSTRHPDGSPIHQVETREDGVEYPTGLKLGLITLALCLSVFLMALDNAIIATAIPKITEEFHSLPDVGWYGSAYLLTTAALQLLFGKFYSFLSLKLVYLVAIGFFELGSLICGVAPNSVALIIGRAVAGLGSAGVFSGALLILAHSVPLAKRPLYSGLVGGMYGIASVAGPLLGGVFTDKVTWRWCFYINLPIGAITILVIAFFFQDPRAAHLTEKTESQKTETLLQRIRRFDPIGTLIFMPAVISLLLALQWGGTMYPWSDGRIIGLFVVFGVLILAFLYVQHIQQENATVPPRIIAKRTVYASCLFAFAIGSSFFIFVYYIPIWFQSVQGVSAVDSGIRNLPMLLSVVVLSLVAGGVISAWGYYAPFMIAGTVLTSIGGGLLTTFTPETSSGAWIGYQILYGAGVGMSLQQPLIAVQTVLDIKDIPVGTAVVVFMQTIGGALFVSVGQNIFSNSLVQELAANVPSADPAAVLLAGATNLRQVLDPALVPGVILSYSNALTTAFIVGLALAVFSIFGSVLVEWKSVKGKNIEMGMA